VILSVSCKHGRLTCSQVWKNRKVWEGFVKCCQRTKPQSFLVLLQLPAVQLRDAFTLCPELREPLLSHIQTLTPHQVAATYNTDIKTVDFGVTVVYFFIAEVIVMLYFYMRRAVSDGCAFLCGQRAHIPKAIMSVLEKDANEQKAVEKARRVEEERLTQQEKLYQVFDTIICTVRSCKVTSTIKQYLFFNSYA